MNYSKRRGIAVVAVVSFIVGAAAVGRLVSAQTGGTHPVTNAIAQPPRLLAYSGFLESNGTTVDQSMPMRFFITDAPTDVVASALWVSGASTMPVNVNDGHFAVVLGDAANGQNAFSSDLFARTSIYLRVEVNGEVLSGAQRLVATPYAITAETPTTTAFRVATIQAAHFVGPYLTGEVEASKSGGVPGETIQTIVDAPNGVTAFCSLTQQRVSGTDTDIVATSACTVSSTDLGGGVVRWQVRAYMAYVNGSNAVYCRARCLVIP